VNAEDLINTAKALMAGNKGLLAMDESNVTCNKRFDNSGIRPTEENRRAYRDLSRLYHPDTTQLSPDIAVAKFQLLNEAYATLNNSGRRALYDRTIAVPRTYPISSLSPLHRPAATSHDYSRSAAYLNPVDRPLSAGEIFALFILGLTFLGCLVLAVAIGLTRGDMSLTSSGLVTPPSQIAAPADTLNSLNSN